MFTYLYKQFHFTDNNQRQGVHLLLVWQLPKIAVPHTWRSMNTDSESTSDSWQILVDGWVTVVELILLEFARKSACLFPTWPCERKTSKFSVEILSLITFLVHVWPHCPPLILNYPHISCVNCFQLFFQLLDVLRMRIKERLALLLLVKMASALECFRNTQDFNTEGLW